MSQQELLKQTVEILDKIKMGYMITGSVVSSLQGEPRSTHDIDIVIAIKKEDVNNLIKHFAPDFFYIDKSRIENAISTKRMFNVIDLKEGDKIDFWILTDEPFDKSRFARKYLEPFYNFKISVTSPEDTILAKLRWAVLSGGSEKQFTDAVRVYEVQYNSLDIEYIEKWVKILNLEEIWNSLIDKAEII